MDRRARPDITEYFSQDLRRRIATALVERAAEAERRAVDLAPDTAGKMYVDLVRESLRRLGTRVPDEFSQVRNSRPAIYRVGDLRLVHCSVHLDGEEHVSNDDKRAIATYLRSLAQDDFLPASDRDITNLDGPLVVLATHLEQVRRRRPQLTLRRAFIGYPRRMDARMAIRDWHEGRLELLAVAESSGPLPAVPPSITPQEPHHRVRRPVLRAEVQAEVERRRRAKMTADEDGT